MPREYNAHQQSVLVGKSVLVVKGIESCLHTIRHTNNTPQRCPYQTCAQRSLEKAAMLTFVATQSLFQNFGDRGIISSCGLREARTPHGYRAPKKTKGFIILLRCTEVSFRNVLIHARRRQESHNSTKTTHFNDAPSRTCSQRSSDKETLPTFVDKQSLVQIFGDGGPLFVPRATLR